VTIRFDELPDPPDPRTSEDMLRELCERQTAEIFRLRRELAESDARNLRLANQLTDASKERKAALLSIQDQLAALRTTTNTVISQRDTLETVLRRLVSACNQYGRLGRSGEAYAVLARIQTQANELVTVIDQLKAAEQNKPQG
jgi:hypothetical protein